jgi:hypothetical protein
MTALFIISGFVLGWLIHQYIMAMEILYAAPPSKGRCEDCSITTDRRYPDIKVPRFYHFVCYNCSRQREEHAQIMAILNLRKYVSWKEKIASGAKPVIIEVIPRIVHNRRPDNEN